ncbi:MAG: transporter, partial [Acidobacteriota bacterium]|nr:transporter [Acidobacteriota bacterium]
MTRHAAALLVLVLLACARPLFAGPPFQTDDPQPVDFRHYEFYIFGADDGTPVENDPVGPAAEFNWGAAPRLQIHVVFPMGAIIPSNNPAYLPGGAGPSAYGIADTELGAKFEWLKETKYRPMVGTFTMMEIPTGSYSKGLGVGTPWFKLPVWLQKSWGHWTTYGGGGYEINPQAQYNNFPYEGWLVQRDIGKKLTLGTEVFHHGAEGYATAQIRATTMIDTGGYYYFRNPGFQLLFCYGHSLAGMSENYAYLGLYWTWGS